MFGLSDSWTGIISAVLIAVITSFVTHNLAILKERRLQTEKYKLEILEKVYTPLYRSLINKMIKDYNNPFGYSGIDPDLYNDIYNIYKQHIYLIDPGLEKRFWEIKAHFEDEKRRMSEMKDEHFIQMDYEYRFIRYVSYQYNKMRRKLNLPYEKTYFKYHDATYYTYNRVIMYPISYFKGHKIKKDLEKYRQSKSTEEQSER
ncbi:hypothetical protein [Virgibacillus halodenitrificans]|uniref:hypothetical protein n=1 Tax=Virgibacillus halodenitrificans TaxID=1482 RepID=UPI000EF542DA|nr:hypothetical protein [Virgibacillus halodenitrificans]